MTTPKQNRKIVQAFITIAIIIVVFFCVRWYLGDRQGAPGQGTEPGHQTPSVVLSEAMKTDLAAPREYIGRVESIQSVEVRPQIAGEINGVHFKEGSTVKAGQLLFSIDDKTQQATAALRKADLAKAEANDDRASRYYERLKAADSRSVSDSDLDVARNDVLQCKAAIEQAKASLRLAQIDLGYTKITAPISGQIGKAFFTKGNYVTPAGGVLAEIVQIDPIRVAFSMPDRDYLEQLDAFKASGSAVLDVAIRLPDGKAYPLRGARDFEDNVMDQRTSTMMMRVRFKNDKGALIPGSMVRVEARPSKSHIAVVIPMEAILADREGDYVYQVDDGNIARMRRVTLGVEAGTMREIISGIDAGERIVVRGLQSLRPDIAVTPMDIKNGAAKTPAELAQESIYDVKPIADKGKAEPEKPAEGDK